MKRPLRILGLVRGRTYDALAEQRTKAEARAARLVQQLEETKATTRLWKEKTEEADDALKKAQDAAAVAHKQLRQAEKLREEQSRNARKQKEESDKLRKVQEERAAELVLLKQRLADSERDLNVAREQLMAIEVKLDILEGAANILDVRTRDILARRSGISTGSGTAV